MIICIARLRSNVNYLNPLEHIVDSFFYVLEDFMKNNPQHEYVFYNCGFGTKHKRNVNAIKIADVIIIPSEAEFTYHIPGLIHTLDVKKSNEELNAILPYIENKKVIILRSDRGDNEELYRKVFPVPFEYNEIDENDFDGNIHSIKYHFIKKISTVKPKQYDFIYWGSEKRKLPNGNSSGDVRHIILKEIRKSGIPSLYVGRIPTRDYKWMKMKDLVPFLNQSHSTLCFNWTSNLPTSRYLEAVATGVFPFVWKTYDDQNTFVLDEYQRVQDSKELLEKIQDKDYNRQLLQEITNKIETKIKQPKEYSELFDEKLKRLI